MCQNGLYSPAVDRKATGLLPQVRSQDYRNVWLPSLPCVRFLKFYAWELKARTNWSFDTHDPAHHFCTQVQCDFQTGISWPMDVSVVERFGIGGWWARRMGIRGNYDLPVHYS
jgi:hypothetical protein